MRISDWSSDVCSSDLSCLILLEEGNGRKIAGGAPAARLVSRFPHFVLIAAASDLRRRAAGRSAALPLNQAAKAFCQDQRGGAHRSEERRVGKECVSTCRSRGSPYN